MVAAFLKHRVLALLGAGGAAADACDVAAAAACDAVVHIMAMGVS